MNFEVDRYSSAWAHIALCADLTWASEPPDDFIIANQRIWAQHCRLTQVLQDTVESQRVANNHCNLTDQRLVSLQENGNYRRKSVKDVIPESRLAQFYGNFYYDDIRENCYTCTNEKANSRYNGNGCENSDLTECWMLPEVAYWFRKLMDNSDRSLVPRRRRQYKMLVDDDLTAKASYISSYEDFIKIKAFKCPCKIVFNIAINGHRSAASERWGPNETNDEDVLEAKIRSVRVLWNQPAVQKGLRAPSPPPVSRKIRARRRQPRKLTTLAPSPPAYCLDDAQLHCDFICKFQFETPHPPKSISHQRAKGRLSSNVQALMRANTSRCSPYRGTNVGRYAPAGPRPIRYPERRSGVWWPCKNVSPRSNKLNSTVITNTILQNFTNNQKIFKSQKEPNKGNLNKVTEQSTSKQVVNSEVEAEKQKEKIINDGELPSTSKETTDDIQKKRLYSTVLSMSAPPININPVIRLSQKLAPGLIKLNPKIAFSARIRPSVDKFEELEKEALEQYKDSDESIDTKFRELEKEAVDQYSTSNSNTSCSSGNSGVKSNVKSETMSKDSNENFHGYNSVDSVVEYTQNFPNLISKKQTINLNLKNFHAPLRGDKKEHRLNKYVRNIKDKSKRPASDTYYNFRDLKETHKSMRWTLPKKRHLSVSDFSSDEELKDTVSLKDVGPFIRNHFTGKVKMSAHGGGDLNPFLQKI